MRACACMCVELEWARETAGAGRVDWQLWAHAGEAHDAGDRTSIPERLHLPTAQRGTPLSLSLSFTLPPCLALCLCPSLPPFLALSRSLPSSLSPFLALTHTQCYIINTILYIFVFTAVKIFLNEDVLKCVCADTGLLEDILQSLIHPVLSVGGCGGVARCGKRLHNREELWGCRDLHKSPLCHLVYIFNYTHKQELKSHQ